MMTKLFDKNTNLCKFKGKIPILGDIYYAR